MVTGSIVLTFINAEKYNAVVSPFDSNQATTIKQSQKKVQDIQMAADSQIIYNNYNGLVEAL